MKQSEIAEFIAKNLPRHKHFSLATVDELGRPWVVYLQLCYDENLSIFWVSAKDSEHSKHIKLNPEVALLIAGENEDVGDFGLYMKGRAREVVDKSEAKRLISLRANKLGKPVADSSEFLDNSIYRLYVADIEKAWLNDDSHVKKEVDLSILREKYGN